MDQDTIAKISELVLENRSAHNNKEAGLTIFRLLDLPPEIRNLVYEHLFNDIADTASLAIHSPGHVSEAGLALLLLVLTHEQALALHGTCRQVRSESRCYAYGSMRAKPAVQIEDCWWLGDGWGHRPLSARRLGEHISRGFAPTGDMLWMVKHLDLDSIAGLCLLLHSDSETLRVSLEAYDWVIKDPCLRHKTDDVEYLWNVLRTVRDAMPLVTVITVQVDLWWRVHDAFRVDRPWWPANGPTWKACSLKQHGGLIRAFPLTKELRLTGREYNRRLKRTAQERWRHWYVPE
jgi:hypothetical protein